VGGTGEMNPIRVTIWNEFRHERENPKYGDIYPDGMHGAIAAGFIGDQRFTVAIATLDEPEHGLTDARLAETDVLIWWGHMAHGEVADEIVARVHQRVLDGMGLIVLHSAHFSKIFKRLMGTSCDLKWREAADVERLWVVDPGHPIVDGIGEYIELPGEEMYGEHFDIPQPDKLVFISWFTGGEVFRSGCCYSRGAGKIFYFRPGHESYPTYFNPDVQRVIRNASAWAAPVAGPDRTWGRSEPANDRSAKG
jgi:trehalose utilization protein